MGWLCVCPDLDIVFVVYDWYPSKNEKLLYQTAFHVKNGAVKVVGASEAEKLYKEYQRKSIRNEHGKKLNGWLTEDLVMKNLE